MRNIKSLQIHTDLNLVIADNYLVVKYKFISQKEFEYKSRFIGLTHKFLPNTVGVGHKQLTRKIKDWILGHLDLFGGRSNCPKYRFEIDLKTFAVR